jgi:hypothetical protein
VDGALAPLATGCTIKFLAVGRIVDWCFALTCAGAGFAEGALLSTCLVELEPALAGTAGIASASRTVDVAALSLRASAALKDTDADYMGSDRATSQR